MQKEPTDFQVFLMALIFTPLVYVLLWLAMALF
jgi:hypothetical protein